jgi:hypothetical protein
LATIIGFHLQLFGNGANVEEPKPVSTPAIFKPVIELHNIGPIQYELEHLHGVVSALSLDLQIPVV